MGTLLRSPKSAEDKLRDAVINGEQNLKKKTLNDSLRNLIGFDCPKTIQN